MNNKEIKDLLIINLICTILIIILSFFVSNNLYKMYERQHTEDLANMVDAIVSKYPDAESDIISRISIKRNPVKGYELLEKYGYTYIGNTEMKTAITKSNLTTVIIGLVIMLIINVLFI